VPARVDLSIFPILIRQVSEIRACEVWADTIQATRQSRITNEAHVICRDTGDGYDVHGDIDG
jgi:hypothetical protein